ncbi:hypothetical protein ABII15_36545 [Streptomyces sp. HUAS MG91]|uniref:Uncharacterized protein n=1 Tax=Streptomyces tabacisoli TaxID=3156398 RepID=A0AAU8J2G6_9ACTN
MLFLGSFRRRRYGTDHAGAPSPRAGGRATVPGAVAPTRTPSPRTPHRTNRGGAAGSRPRLHHPVRVRPGIAAAERPCGSIAELGAVVAGPVAAEGRIATPARAASVLVGAAPTPLTRLFVEEPGG